jgi:nucleotide-binding universal stress UspA family protein
VEPYKRILVTTDGSSLAMAAMPHAAQLARALRAEVVVLEVVRSPRDEFRAILPDAYELSGRADPYSFAAAVLAERQAAQAHLRAAEALLRAEGARRVSKHIAEGWPAPTILAVAEQLDCDLIVMATRGHSGLKRALLGSVAEEVSRRSTRAPVLLVHPEPVVEREEVHDEEVDARPAHAVPLA